MVRGTSVELMGLPPPAYSLGVSGSIWAYNANPVVQSGREKEGKESEMAVLRYPRRVYDGQASLKPANL